ncbi:MAG: MFS transporter [Novosphingobium sp.]|nr:MFS transporter [Novosphingobium sp.]
MLGFGFASGLPFALLIGTLNAWLGEVGINLATIGVLSWIGLSYSFKFLWSPLVDRVPLPLLDRLGRRRSWIALCQAVLVVSFAGLAFTDPKSAIGTLALLAFAAAFASATQDIAIDAWRIDVADEESPLELLSALNQFGYRTASIVGGAFALFLAARLSWPQVFMVMTVLMALAATTTVFAPDTPRASTGTLHADLGQPGEIGPKARAGLLFAVLASWIWALVTVGGFMVRMLAPLPPGGKLPSVSDFTKAEGPWIIAATVVVPLAAAALANALKARAISVLSAQEIQPGGLRSAANHTYAALIAPLAELSARAGWGVLTLIGFILSYALCYNIWASFAFPFYLDTLHYTKDEVAFASKIFGIFMTMLGISLCGYLFARIGRFPTVLLGALLPPLGNLVYADLAEGGARIDAFAHLLRLNLLAQALGSDDRMVRLLLAICYENISVGLALTAFVAYLSSMVSKRYTAIQYALLGSLTSLVGTLGRGVVGEAFGQYGYAPVFRLTALAGLVSVLFVCLEWVRVSRKVAVPTET